MFEIAAALRFENPFRFNASYTLGALIERYFLPGIGVIIRPQADPHEPAQELRHLHPLAGGPLADPLLEELVDVDVQPTGERRGRRTIGHTGTLPIRCDSRASNP